MFPKPITHRSEALRKSAQGESCVACGREDGTVVWAHRNEGKGMGLKQHDLLGLYLCQACHSWYDQGKADRDEKRRFFEEHYPATMARVAEKLARKELRL